ncbi:hypothetical protein GCM10010335_70080 [Streptomyces galbus]|nr:hypothetical protein GCM10010335_70080 [Streptomyces galbus]
MPQFVVLGKGPVTYGPWRGPRLYLLRAPAYGGAEVIASGAQHLDRRSSKAGKCGA